MSWLSHVAFNDPIDVTFLNLLLDQTHIAQDTYNGNGKAFYALLSLGIIPTADSEALTSYPAALTSDGTQIGGKSILRANSFTSSTNHTRDFSWRVKTTTNAGAGMIELLTRLDSGSWTSLFSIDSTGLMTATISLTPPVTIIPTANTDAIEIYPAALVGAGTQIGGLSVSRANSFDTGAHTRDFAWRPSTTSNAGAGIYELLTRVDGGAWSVLGSVTAAGVWSLPGTAIPTTQSVVTGSRALTTVYHNTGTAPLHIAVTVQATSTNSIVQAYTDASATPTTFVVAATQPTNGQYISVNFIVLPGNYYKVLAVAGSFAAPTIWTEWA